MIKFATTFLILSLSILLRAQTPQATNTEVLDLNKAERAEWFRDLGFGMFIDFSFDSQLGIITSHSMVDASEDYKNRYLNELPKTFNPKNFDAQEIAQLAKIAGMKFIVFTAKHPSGFCMWDTETTDFNITNTPYSTDMLEKYVEATRKAGLAVGLYFSANDYNFFFKNGVELTPAKTSEMPQHIMKKYLELNELQTIELMAKYGDIDILFYDGAREQIIDKCKQVAWELHDDVVIKSGVLTARHTVVPEINSTGLRLDKLNTPMLGGTNLVYDKHKSTKQLVETLIETRAKGNNQLFHVDLKSNGEIPEQQKTCLQKIAAWNFINGEAIVATAPWIIPNEDNIWFTWNPEEKTLFAIITQQHKWQRDERREFVLKSVKTSNKSKIDVLGQSSEALEFEPLLDDSTRFKQEKDGLHISCIRRQWLSKSYNWNYPLVLKITHAEPTFDPPAAVTMESEIINMQETCYIKFIGEITNRSNEEPLKAFFQYRPHPGLSTQLNANEWKETKTMVVTNDTVINKVPVKKEKSAYQYRLVVQHPRAIIYGQTKTISQSNQ